MHKPLALILIWVILSTCGHAPEPIVEISPEDTIVTVGGNLCSRMLNYGEFESRMYANLPDHDLRFRNMCDGGNTPGFRPHAGRSGGPWAFPGAEDYQTEFAKPSDSHGFFPTEEEWLDSLDADVILAFFGYAESFEGPERLSAFALELDTFIRYTKGQTYNDDHAPELVIVGPLAYEGLGTGDAQGDVAAINENLELYTRAMRDMAVDNGVEFVDLYAPSSAWFSGEDEQFTIDGFQLNARGHEKLADYLTGYLLGMQTTEAPDEELLAAVNDKNWYWKNDFKIPNGVHVFGRRHEPYGPDNYPFEVRKVRQMTHNRDLHVQSIARGDGGIDLAAEDAKTEELPEVETNFEPDDESKLRYRYGEDALATFTTAPGYKIELFAGEEEFPELANPAQMAFDNQGRLWIATLPSYPHYRPGDSKPNDKLVILEDTDKDGKADKSIVWADGLHLPVGFGFAAEGVYVSQGTDLVLLRDTDGDDRADSREIVLSGFDDHDTHHNISAYAADPSGALYMGEGIFLHTNVETPHGTVRATDGGFYRYDPRRKKLERTAQIAIPNPWGIAFDEWGQPFFANTSNPPVRWMLPSTIKSLYGYNSPMTRDLIEPDHRVRPTSGLEFIHSRHFPDEVQGDMILNNTIGFLGTKQHRIFEDGTGYDTRWRQDLVQSTDPNYRPVDLEIAPDGSLYIVDWHNILVGHMQHNARDPLRDHQHGRIYRITYPGRPLVPEAEVDGASVETLFENLKLPEYRTRERSRRELREHDADEILAYAKEWLAELDPADPDYPRHQAEALFTTWGGGSVDGEMLDALLSSDDHRLRAAVVRVVRYMGHQLPNRVDLLKRAAADDHGRVRLEAIVAASWLSPDEGEPVLAVAENYPIDEEWMAGTFEAARAHMNRQPVVEEAIAVSSNLEGETRESFVRGAEIYAREGYCGTCHQPDGKGLAASGYPPLTGTRWAQGDPERLIKLTLHGLYGPIEVLGKTYPGNVPMTAYGGLLSNQEIADVLTYVRNSFGNVASPITADQVGQVSTRTAGRKKAYKPEELLQEHPM